MARTPQDIAVDYAARWANTWNLHGATATAELYTSDGVLVGLAIARGKTEIAQALEFIFNQGWRQISIEVVSAHALGDLVLAVSEFSARGSGPAAGKLLQGKSSHALTRIGDTWLSAMHTAVSGVPTQAG
jgi:uncharacterized protein (TIGR02246 family)